jgi:CelD/BcsL family acetyltransferase involved in cellulose biosynthesis
MGRFVDQPADLIRLRESWNRLCLAQPRPNPMLSWEWATAWWEVYGAPDPSLALAVWVGDAGDGIVPLHRIDDGKRVMFRLIGTGEPEADAVCADHLGPLFDPASPNLAGEFALDLAERLPRARDSILLTDLSEEAAEIDRHLRVIGLTTRRTPGPRCPYAGLPASYEVWLKGRSSNFRSQLKQSEKALGLAEVRWVETPADLDPFWNALVGLHQARSAQLRRPGVFASVRFSAFHREVTTRFLNAGWLLAGALVREGRAVAATYSFRMGGTVFFYQSGIDPNAPAKERPGLLLHAATIRRAIELGDREYDLLRGDDPYKQRFTEESRRLWNVEAGRRSLLRSVRWGKSALREKLRPLRARLTRKSRQ